MLINNLTTNYTQLPNEIITDTDISDTAYRIFSYLRMKPTGWNVYNKDIQKNLNIKSDKTMATKWKELLTAGYITRRKNSEGKKAGS